MSTATILALQVIEFACGVAAGWLLAGIKWPSRKAAQPAPVAIQQAARPEAVTVTHRVARSRIILHADTREVDRLQIEQAAAGMISGTLGEWPYLAAALRRYGEFWPAGTPARMIKRACIELLVKEGPANGNLRLLRLPEMRKRYF
jgi:hypothetical protein